MSAAYDAYLIACAEAQRASLITLDSGLTHAARAARAAGITVQEVAQ